MNTDVLRLTLRMLLGRRRTLLLLLISLLPVIVAIAYRASDGNEDPLEWTANALFGAMIVAIFLPLAALVFGTAAFGAESEDGTLVYILARPISRASVIAAKFVAAALATTAVVLPSALVAAAIAVGGTDDGLSLIFGFTIAILAGIAVYSALFLCLGVVTSRAFIIGLVYVFVWEGVVTGIFRGARNLSVRAYTLGVADGLAGVPDSAFDADIGIATAVVMMIIVGGIATWLSIRGAQRFQFGEGG
jgi:ABC-2 type transport system permease protein